MRSGMKGEPSVSRGTRQSRRLDVASVIGIPLGIGLVTLGQFIEGGSIGSLIQPTAAVIVFGGTLGAVLLSFSRDDIHQAFTSLPGVFVIDRLPIDETIDKLVGYATRARRMGLIALQDALDREPDPYVQKGLTLAVDGIDQQSIRDTLEIDELSLAEEAERPARVFEAAGGYSPTFGILGAVLGLIHVMEHLADPSRLGAGIAVAFVATVYGVGSANLVFLPIASKLRTKARRAAHHREIALEGILSIQEGINPALLEQKLQGYVIHAPSTDSTRRASAA